MHDRVAGPVLSRLQLLPAALLLLALGVTSVHHHVADETGRGCAVCSVGHMAGAAPVATVQAAPTPHVERVWPEPAAVTHAAVVPTPDCRAPPSA